MDPLPTRSQDLLFRRCGLTWRAVNSWVLFLILSAALTLAVKYQLVSMKIENIIDRQVLGDSIKKKRIIKWYGFLFCALLAIWVGWFIIALTHSDEKNTGVVQWWGQVIAAGATAVIVICYCKSLV